MFDKSAIETLQQADAIRVASDIVREDKAAALPEGFALHDLEIFRQYRRRERGTMNTTNVDSLFEYCQDHRESGATVFVNPEKMTATAVLNFGTTMEPGHCDNVANLELKKTAAFVALLNTATGQKLSQTFTAEFFEDWSDLVKFENEDGALLEPKKAIAAFRKLTIESMQKLEASEQQLGASRSTFESVKASSENGIATTIHFTCLPYQELTERTFTLRLSIITGPDKPAISLRIKNYELHQEEMAIELSNIIDKIFGAALQMPVLLGTYAAKK